MRKGMVTLKHVARQRRIAAKVIDFRGNEVMRVVGVGAGAAAQKAR